MTVPRILIQLDSDAQASTFDAVVAVDAGVEQLFRHGSVTEENVTGLVHGAMFTRGGEQLQSTALFIGGTDVVAGERLLSAVKQAFFGPVRVSVMLDSNGCNTTASAAVLSAGKHLDLSTITALVMGGTGPVGRRVARLLGRQGATVRIGSRSPERAEQAAAEVAVSLEDAQLHGVSTAGDVGLDAALDGCQAVFACGAAGVQLIDADALKRASELRLLVDLNAVPPAGIAGVAATDKGATDALGRIAYGALGVGGLKMKIHRAAIEQLFQANDHVLDADQIYAIGEGLLP